MNVFKTSIQIFKRAAAAGLLCLLTLTSASALSNGSGHLPSETTANGNFLPPSAKFERVWVDYDVQEGGREGMLIHLKFTCYGLKDVDTQIRVNFQTSDGTALKDKNNNFSTTAGTVAAFKDLRPGYEPTVYNDLTVFMPYDELDLAVGKYNLRMDIDLIYNDGTLIQHLTFEPFSYTKSDTAPTASIKRVWIDYNVAENGRKGMRVHVNFEVKGLQGVDTKLVTRIQKPDGSFLASSSPTYSNRLRELEFSFLMKPGYPVSVYEDATMFVPYSEIKLPRGEWDLKFDIDLNYDNGELIEHLHLEEFSFTQP